MNSGMTTALPPHTTARSLLATLLLLVIFSPAAFARSNADDEVTPQVQALYEQAKAAQQRGDNATAIEKYRAMLKLAPHLAPAYNNLGRLYFNEHDYSHAAQTLTKGLELNPDMPTASALLGLSYVELGEDEKAEPLLEAAVRANPDDDNAEMALARSLIHLGRYNQATPYLRSYLDHHPQDQQAWYLLGKTYLQLSQDALGKINQIDPNSVVAHEIAGEIDESMHNYDGALVEYKKAVDMAPQQPGTHMHMADTFSTMGKWDSAQTEFKAELANDPNNCTARWMLANATLEASGSTEDALSGLNQAIERCPNLMQARVDRGRALIKLNRQKEALPDLLLAEKDSPKEPSIHFLLSQVYKAGGQSAEAQQELRTYAQLQREASEAVAGQASDAISIKSTAH
jgi:tetratricopeptide (TPR) repeat protein